MAAIADFLKVLPKINKGQKRKTKTSAISQLL